MKHLQLAIYASATLSILAAAIHDIVMPEHFGEWWGHGTFFLVAALAQFLYGLAIVEWPRRRLLAAGIVGNLAIVALWLVSRTVGVPLVGPEAGQVEPVGALDAATTLIEVALVALLALAIHEQGRREPDGRRAAH